MTTITLPADLVPVLARVGIHWPDGDETKLIALGTAWQALGDRMAGLARDADLQARTIWACNFGAGIDAIRRVWTSPDAPVATLRDGAEAARQIAAGLFLAARILVVYKLKVLAELTWVVVSTAAMVRAALLTRGASLLAIPFLPWIARRAIDELTNVAIGELLNA